MEEENCSQLLEEVPSPILIYYSVYLLVNSDENNLLESAAFAWFLARPSKMQFEK